MSATLPPLRGVPAGDEWAGTYVLPNSTRSPALARVLLRQALSDRPRPVIGTAELLVSELVTNAVRHAETDLLLHITLDPRIRVVVEDTSADAIREPRPFGDDAGGRGLAIVAAMAVSWGWERTASGKRTWFEL